MRIFAYVNFALAALVALFYGLGASLTVVLVSLSPDLLGGLTGAISRISAGGGVKALLVDAMGWPGWVFPFSFGIFASILAMGRHRGRV